MYEKTQFHSFTPNLTTIITSRFGNQLSTIDLSVGHPMVNLCDGLDLRPCDLRVLVGADKIACVAWLNNIH